jgi:hypothetical protein
MTVAALALAVAAFVAVLRLSGTVAVAGQAAATARQAARVLRTPGLADDVKEAHSRRAAAALFGSFVRIAAAGFAGLALSFALIWLGAASGLYELSAALRTAASPAFLLGATVLATLGWIATERLGRRAS